MLPLLIASGAVAAGQVRHLPLSEPHGRARYHCARSLLFAAGKTAQPELATVCGSASGAITVILAWIFLKEKIVYLRWLGIAATFSGIAALSALK